MSILGQREWKRDMENAEAFLPDPKLAIAEKALSDIAQAYAKRSEFSSHAQLAQHMRYLANDALSRLKLYK